MKNDLVTFAYQCKRCSARYSVDHGQNENCPGCGYDGKSPMDTYPDSRIDDEVGEGDFEQEDNASIAPYSKRLHALAVLIVSVGLHGNMLKSLEISYRPDKSHHDIFPILSEISGLDGKTRISVMRQKIQSIFQDNVCT